MGLVGFLTDKAPLFFFRASSARACWTTAPLTALVDSAKSEVTMPPALTDAFFFRQMQRAPSTPRLGDDTKPSNMLPTTAVRPLHAELRMRIEPRAKGSHGTLHGALALELEVSEPVQSVTLHAHRLILRTPAALQSANASEALDCEAWTVDEDAQTVTFTWARLLEVGHYTLFVEWSVDTANTPPPRPGQRGWPGLLFAITSPTDYQHMTQFEPCNARTAYPCFDQPNTKCTFRLTLSNVPVGLVALSNTTVEREELSETVSVRVRRAEMKPTASSRTHASSPSTRLRRLPAT